MHPPRRLILSWNRFAESPSAPFILQGDECLLDRKNEKFVRSYRSFEDYASGYYFMANTTKKDKNKEDKKFHTGLLPIPFIGNLSAAKIFILTLNPGLSPGDYFGEYRVPEYQQALLKNLRQGQDSTFIFLDSCFSWHGGFKYWYGKLNKTIDEFVEQNRQDGVNLMDAIRLFQNNIAVIQFVPYHSLRFGAPARLMRSLKSVELAKGYVHNVLVPKAKLGECVIIATRSVKHWDLPEHENGIIIYSGKGKESALSASLGPETRGGKAILAMLKRFIKQ